MTAPLLLGFLGVINLASAGYFLATWDNHADTFAVVIGVVVFCSLARVAWDIRNTKTNRLTQIQQENQKVKRLLSDTWEMIDAAELYFGEPGSVESIQGWKMYRKLEVETIYYRV